MAKANLFSLDIETSLDEYNVDNLEVVDVDGVDVDNVLMEGKFAKN